MDLLTELCAAGRDVLFVPSVDTITEKSVSWEERVRVGAGKRGAAEESGICISGLTQR